MCIHSLVKQYEAAVEKVAALQKETRSAVLRHFGDNAGFLNSLKIKVINRPNDPNFPELYAFYSTVFTLPDETETFEGFEATLRLNSDRLLLERFGPHEETWIYLREPVTGVIIAGVDFSIYVLPECYRKVYGFTATNHIIYIFVKPEYRGLGVASYLLGLAEEYALAFSGNQGPVLFFCEQNAPELMTAEEYFLDNLNALIDQCERLKWWDRLGYKRLNFNYVQPPLNPGMEPCLNLTFNVRAGAMKEIPSELVREHLERFFSIAVFKGRDASADPIVERQMQWIRQHSIIGVSGSQAYYETLRKDIYSNYDGWLPVKQLFKEE
ncbi:MAG: GNAT family N-acetyltransferase [Bacteroidales bacterium]|jgi:GNAT superfamily N-acetyltransferase|nr:GNAT family N-acetyltransferase [Bacteroidales bacterium]